MEIYFDNSATTRPYKDVCAHMADVAYNIYGNPSSLHTKGMEAEKLLKNSRKIIAKSIGCREDEIYFTSGGTESANLAIFGTMSRTRKKRIMINAAEHPCVMNPVLELEKKGFLTDIIPVDKNGFADISYIEENINDDVALICVMQTNNEVGSVNNIEKISEIVRKSAPQCYIFSDAVQAYGKMKVSSAFCDFISLSSHKIHGPKGVGALYVRKGTKLNPHIFGGGQEKNLRSGTENIAGICGFSKAVENFRTHDTMAEVKMRLYERIKSDIPHAVFNNNDFENSSPHILNVSFPGARSEVILHFLEAEGIFVSSGSACSSNKPGKSPTLSAMGCKNDVIDSAIRFSFSYENTAWEADICADKLIEILPKIRRKK